MDWLNGKPTRLALLKEIAEFLNEETETYSMLQGALKSLIDGSEFTTGWIFSLMMWGSMNSYHIMVCQAHWKITIVSICEKGRVGVFKHIKIRN